MVDIVNTVWFFETTDSNTSSCLVWSMFPSLVPENCFIADIMTIHTNRTINSSVMTSNKRALLFGSSETRVTLLWRAGNTSSCLSMKMVISVGLNLLKDTFRCREESDLLLEESAWINLASSSLYEFIPPV